MPDRVETQEQTPGAVAFQLLDRGTPVPLAAITQLRLVAWYNEDGDDPDDLVNARADIALITDGVVATDLPDGVTFTYALTTDPVPVLVATLGYRAADQAIADEALPYERHTILLECTTTASPDPVPLEIKMAVKNLRRVGAA